MITFYEMDKDKTPEYLKFGEEDVLLITGFKKLDDFCTSFAITKDLKHLVNIDWGDWYQLKKFNKQDMLDIIRDLIELTDKMQEDATCWDCQYLLESAHSHVDGSMPECGHTDAPDESGIPDLNHIPEWCPISGQTKEFKDWCRKWALI